MTARAAKLTDPNFTVPRALMASLPIVAAYLPVAFTLGIAAGQLHFSIFESILFFGGSLSGSAQSIALQMLRNGLSPMTIWPITIIVNLRYFLMSSALAPSLSVWPKPLRYLFSLFVTDELFALHASQFRTEVPPPWYVFVINVMPLIAWTTGGVFGHLAGNLVEDTRLFGFDFAVPGMFIALVVMQIEDKRMLGLGVLGGAIGLLLSLSPLKSWAILISGIVCASVGTWMEKCKTR